MMESLGGNQKNGLHDSTYICQPFEKKSPAIKIAGIMKGSIP